LSSQLDALPVQRRRHPRTKSHQQAEECDDDERRAEPAREPPSREGIDPRRNGEPEQDSEKDGEKQRVREPDELREEVHADDERRGAKHVGAAKARRAWPSVTIRSSRSLGRWRRRRLLEWLRHAFGPGQSECRLDWVA
jgi:hypothetical protein